MAATIYTHRTQIKHGPVPNYLHISAESPTSNNNGTKGYRVGDMWIDTTTATLYICADAGTSAIWTGGMPSLHGAGQNTPGSGPIPVDFSDVTKWLVVYHPTTGAVVGYVPIILSAEFSP